MAPFLLLLLLMSFLHLTTSQHPDLHPLLLFKSSLDPSNQILKTWTTTTTTNSSTPCTSFLGITCTHNRVTHITLQSLYLNGTVSIPSTLPHLRLLSLKNNSLHGPFPNLSSFSSLKLIFLSHNFLSGQLPVNSLPSSLYRLDISFNNFTGKLPVPTLNLLTRLLTLRLEENRFTGFLTGLVLPNLEDFNVSGNGFSGSIPGLFSVFPVSAFLGNPVLCGLPLERKCEPGSAFASPVASSPTAVPSDTKVNVVKGSRKIGSLAIVGIILGDVLVLGLVSLLLYCYFWRNYSNKTIVPRKSNVSGNVEKIVYSSSPYPNNNTGGSYERGKMVFFEGERRFELEDLLRASAEMLGKGGFGTAYKAILDDGNVVAVKRLKDLNVNASGKREFEGQMEVLGRLKHGNLVGLKAYYFARDEKLLVCEYMPNGNLFWLLHGNRGPGRTPLDWTTRLKIAAGAARGLAFIHNSCKSLKLVHGNIKSTNILIDKTGNARVSDFGLSIFSSPSSAPKSNGYRAPEAALDGRKLTQKSDVYSFGVLLLELLTGKCPSIMDNSGPGSGYSGVVDLPRWVQSVVREEWTAEVFDLELMRYKDIEEEMVGLLQIGMACTQASPDQRPKMNYVVKMIEELRGVEVSPSHESLDSVSDSPTVSEDTGRASE